MKKVVFFDIDGTLIDWKHGVCEISPRVQKAIRSLQEQGHYAFIATGRPYAFLPQSILDFGFDGFVLMNGAVVKIKDTILHHDSIDLSTLKDFISQFNERNIQYILQGEPCSYIHKDFKELYSFYESIHIDPAYLQQEYALEDVKTCKMELLCPNKESIEFCKSLCGNTYDYVHYYDGNIHIVEFYTKRNTKASGILKVLEHLNIPLSQSYAFGDAKNDIEMLETVNCGIAMGNAHDHIKEHADLVCESIQQDGVAHGIEKYILNEDSMAKN